MFQTLNRRGRRVRQQAPHTRGCSRPSPARPMTQDERDAHREEIDAQFERFIEGGGKVERLPATAEPRSKRVRARPAKRTTRGKYR
jgi:hypothetical protein